MKVGECERFVATYHTYCSIVLGDRKITKRVTSLKCNKVDLNGFFCHILKKNTRSHQENEIRTEEEKKCQSYIQISNLQMSNFEHFKSL